MSESTAVAAPAKTLPSQFAGKRIAGIDLAEAISMYIVIIYHISCLKYRYYEYPEAVTIFNYYIRCFYAAGCPIFFLCNGYLLLNHRFNLKKHIRKTVRMALLTLFWFPAPFLVGCLADGVAPSWALLIEDLTYFRGNVIHLWYLGALVCTYIFFPLIKLAWDHNRKAFLLFTAYIFIAIFGVRVLNQFFTVLAHYTEGYNGLEMRRYWLSVLTMFNTQNGIALCFFCIGGYLPEMVAWSERKFPKTLTRNMVLLTVMLIAGAVHGLWFFFLYHISGTYVCPVWNGFTTVPNLIIVICAMMMCMSYRGINPKIYKVVSLISDQTLGIYFLHMMIVLPLRPLIANHLRIFFNFPSNVVLSVIVLALCIWLTFVIRKIPILNKHI